jgi:uncharacterized membrane protein
METLFTVFLVIHIAGGITGLLAGTVNLISKKGGQRHRRIGKLFAIGMISAGMSALVLSVIHPNTFLFAVGVFTVYMVATGLRYMRHRISSQRKPAILDRLLTLFMLVSALFLIVYGIRLLLHSELFGMVYLTFGVFGGVYVREDVIYSRDQSVFVNYWLMAHISRMTGGYIASLTAFLVVNARHFPFEIPLVIVWLFPSALLVPFIVKWSKSREIRKTI